MLEQLINNTQSQMDKTIEHYAEELKGVRSGRAQASLVDVVRVDVYGQSMMIKQLATVNTPDAKTIAITPWDKSNMPLIEKAIRETASLGLNPSNDGHVIRLNVPPLTEERRRELVKLISDKSETANISLRNARHDALNDVKRQLKAKQISEDEYYKAEQKLNKLIENYQEKVQHIFADKEREMMKV